MNYRKSIVHFGVVVSSDCIKDESSCCSDYNMFNQSSSPFSSTTSPSSNPMKDIEVTSLPEDSISTIQFSYAPVSQNYLVGGSWDGSVCCWEVEQSGKTIPKSMQSTQAPVLDTAWSDDGTKVFIASADKTAKCWDLGSNQVINVAGHDHVVRTCHWIKSPAYSCLVTGSWDKTLKFWDLRSQSPMLSIALPERCYCVDVDYPMAIVGTAGRNLIIYQLDGNPREFKRVESPLKYQHRCVAIFKDKEKNPTGFALGSVEGRVAIQYVQPRNPKDNFTFKCHRSNGANGYQDIYAMEFAKKCVCLDMLQVEGSTKKDINFFNGFVNDIKFHPIHGTLATVGSDGTFSFWDKDARTKLKPSEPMEQPITCCCFNHNGYIFAYAVSYDWSKGHEHYSPAKKNHIFLRPCFEELKPRGST